MTKDFSDNLSKSMYYLKKSLSKEYSISKQKLFQKGAELVKWHNNNAHLKYTMSKMYVVKHDPQGRYKKGTKHFEEEKDIKYRTIRFYKEETRKELKKLLPIFDINHKNQIGFSKDKGVKDLLAWDNIGIRTRVKLDLKNAFDNITHEQLWALLTIVFGIRKRIAKEIADNWTVEGHMVQGHPLTPAIFNLLTRRANDFVSKYVKGVHIVQYADDILIISEHNYVSYKTLRMICKAFKNEGFPMNVEKEGIYHGYKPTKFIGLTYRKVKGVMQWHPSNKRKYKKKIRALRHNIKRGKISDKRGCKIENICLGIQEWLSYRHSNKHKNYGTFIIDKKGKIRPRFEVIQIMRKLFPDKSAKQWKEFEALERLDRYCIPNPNLSIENFA